MELYMREYTQYETSLVTYPDLSRKIVALKKKTDKVILAKAYPTSKACEKFMINTELEIEKTLVSPLINALNGMNASSDWSSQTHIVVGEYLNYKKETHRLLMRSNDFGSGELVCQKKENVLDDEDLSFSDDNLSASVSVVNSFEKAAKWSDQWGNFSFKKTDDLGDIAKKLSRFFQLLKDPVKKRKNKAEPPVAAVLGKKKKKTTKNLENAQLVDDDDDDTVDAASDECELIETLNKINDSALVELLYYYTSNKLSLEDCICRYNEVINEALKDSDKFDFVSAIVSGELENIRLLIGKIL